MIITLYNQTGVQKSYLGGTVVVPASGNVTVARDYNVILAADTSLAADIQNDLIRLNDGFTTYADGAAIEVLKILIQNITAPIATTPLYYSLPVNIEHTGTLTAGGTVWAMTNSNILPLFVLVEMIELTATFVDSTPLVLGAPKYDLCRFSGATPTGGSSITVIKANNTSGSTAITDARCSSTGLTTTSVVFEPAFATISIPMQLGANSHYRRDRLCIKIAPGEGLAIRANTNILSGVCLTGEIAWSER